MDGDNAAVQRIVEGWPSMDLDAWRETCTDDVDYRNMPWADIASIGPAAIHETLSTFASRYDVVMDVIAIGTTGDLVVAERLEHFTPKPGADGEPFRLPVLGIFEVDGEGKVSAWRDYFDRRAMKA